MDPFQREVVNPGALKQGTDGETDGRPAAPGIVGDRDSDSLQHKPSEQYYQERTWKNGIGQSTHTIAWLPQAASLSHVAAPQQDRQAGDGRKPREIEC